MQTTIQEYLAREHFDLMICDDVYNLQNLPTGSGVPVLLNKHDLTYEIMERFKQWQPNPVKAAYIALESKKVRHFEQWACSHVPGVLACSNRDALALNHLSPSSRIWVVPNVIDLATYSPAALEDGMTVLYVGAMDWYPNCDAVHFFISEILPHIEKCVPQVKFAVAGRNPPDKLRRRYASRSNVRFTGTMADLRAEIERAAVCVVPLRIGSGTRLKILEAAAMNKSVVSTHIGAEGLEFVDGRELLLADNPQQFAAAVIDLLRDPKRRRALGTAAHTKVSQQYSVEALFAPLTVALASVC
jgi:glycosyltransferase involved in cell wall biosynthesis